MRPYAVTAAAIAAGALATAPLTARAAVCSIASVPVRFPAYDPTAAAPATATGVITISCQSNANAVVAISRGEAPSFAPRLMHGRGAGTLAYQLYLAPGGAVFGDGTSGTQTRSILAGPAGATVLVYGVIPARQSVAAGVYGDTIGVTIDF